MTSHRLVIAEKPSVAASIAAALGVKEKKDGYIEGGGYLISWCVGHLVELAEAALFIVSRYAALHPRFLPRFLFFQEGLGHFPTSKIPVRRVSVERGFTEKGTLFLCLLRNLFFLRYLYLVVDILPARIS